VNCAAIPESLLEAELFGFERGAFTGAHQAKEGLFQVAHRGTIFLDEVGLLPLTLQTKLLKALEEGVIRRLGSVKTEPIDVWILSATNEDLTVALRQKHFRDDLYHRLAVLVLEIPPLRERGDDVPRLAEHFLRQAVADYDLTERVLGDDTRATLCRYPWPGNVRELRNVMERAALLSDRRTITSEMLGLRVAGTDAPPSKRSAIPARLETALAQTGGNITRAAAILGVTRKTVRAWIDKYGTRVSSGPSPGSATVPPCRLASPLGPREIPGAFLRWEIRHVAFLKATVVDVTARERHVSRILGIFSEKAQAFGGIADGSSPMAMVATFGVEAMQDAATSAGHAALAILTEVERLGRHEGLHVDARVALHVARGLVGVNNTRAELDVDARRDAWNVLDTVIGSCPPIAVVTSQTAESFLNRRFKLTPVPRAGGAYRLVGLLRTGEQAGQAQFIGRSAELDVLLQKLASARAGHGQIVAISGDPGIGKSSLAGQLRRHLDDPEVTFVDSYCVSVTSLQPFHPIAVVVRQICDIGESTDEQEIAARIQAAAAVVGLEAPPVVPFVLRLLGVHGDGQVPGTVAPDVMRRQMFEAVSGLLLRHSQRRTLVILVEDLQWIDPASEEFFEQFAAQVAGHHVLMVTTHRTEYAPRWLGRPHTTHIALPPLSRQESLAILTATCEGQPPPEIADAILDKAQGNPFFVEELARSAREAPGAATISVPETIHEVILARLARLDSDDRRLALAAAVLGKNITSNLLHRVVEASDGSVTATLARLRRADFLIDAPWGPDVAPRYAFKHALIQEVVYGALRVEERRELHGRIARTLDAEFPELCASEPELMAHHYTEAGLVEPAVEYWHKAGQKALERAASREAVGLLNNGLEIIESMPMSAKRVQLELQMCIDLGGPLSLLKGFASTDVEHVYVRARQLCRQSTVTPEQLPLVWGLWRFSTARGDLCVAHELAGQCLSIAQTGHDNARLLEAHRALGITTYHLGDLPASRTHFDRCSTIYDPRVHSSLAYLHGDDPGVGALARAAHVLWLMGYPDQARQRNDAALVLSRQVAHMPSIAYAEIFAAILHQMLGDADRVRERAEIAVKLSMEHGFALWATVGTILLGWARVSTGGGEEGIADIRRGIEAFRGLGTELYVSYYFSLLAHAQQIRGDLDAARRALDEADAVADKTGERFYSAELGRLSAEVLWRQDPAAAPEAEARLEEALVVARRQQARSWELRVAMSLARLRARQGRQDAARACLAEIYTWFTEGFDTRDLRTVATWLGPESGPWLFT
jgi:adenylate cyclase